MSKKRNKKSKKIRAIKRAIVYIILFIVFIVLAKLLYNELIKEAEGTLVINEKEDTVELASADEISIGIIDFDTFNPILSRNEDVLNFTPLIYSSLFKYDKQMKLTNDLVDEYNYNDNKLCIRLKKDILWQDGNDLTSSDIQFTIDMIKEYSSIYASLVKDIESIEIVDKQNFNLILKNDDRTIHTKLTFPIISKTYYENEDFATTYKNLVPMGTGMFRYSGKLNDTEYIFKPNAYYKNEEYKFNQINVKIFSTLGQAISAIKIKKVDIINTKIINYEDYLGTIGYNTVQYQDNTFICLGINKDNKYLSNIDIRKALNIGIDKPQVINDVFNGYGFVSQSIIYPSSYLYNNINESYDINAAKQYLANSNFNEKITLNLLVDTSGENNIAISNIIKENIEKIGININITNCDKSTYLKKLQNKEYDLVLVNFRTSDYIDFNMFTNELYYGIFDMGEYINSNNISNNNYYDETKLSEIYEGIQNYIKENVTYIGIGFKNSTLICNTNLMGVTDSLYRNIFIDINQIYKKK